MVVLAFTTHSKLGEQLARGLETLVGSHALEG